MNKRKLIYFLSAFVLIIGCYALNLSYSLFTQNITTKNNVVDTTIPLINASLETSSFTIPANNGELIRLKIINSGNVDILYGVSVIEIAEGLSVYLVDKTDNEIVGNLESNNNKEILIYVENNNSESININFNLESKYKTVNFDSTSFIAQSNIDCVNKIKLLNDSILARAKDTTITDENKTIYDESFDTSNITGISGENERLLIKTEDDYGTSYVFRGAVKDNYVNFAGFTWRIVRINGDGTVRLILDGTLDSVCVDYEKDVNGNCSKYAGTTSVFNSSYNENAYVGYMYGFTGGVTNKCLTKDDANKYTVDSSTTYTTKDTCEGAGGRWASTPYETTHINKNNSTIKANIDTFYETYIENSEKNIHYEDYLADTLFCGDKTLAEGYESKGYADLISYYGTYDRLYKNSTANPTLMCANNANDDYSRYSVDVQTLKNGKTTNGDLTYPIALLSADELVMAGAFKLIPNEAYYLFDANVNGTLNPYWWSLSPHFFDGYYAYELISYMPSYSLNHDYVNNENYGVRPVINLKADILLDIGKGTKIEPYTLK